MAAGSDFHLAGRAVAVMSLVLNIQVDLRKSLIHGELTVSDNRRCVMGNWNVRHAANRKRGISANYGNNNPL
jgi:hypothetical protein